jgi:hypothetical protein
MAKNITISSANNIGVNNNTYKYNFKEGGIVFDDDNYLSCNQIVVPNSITNVSQEYNNTQFAYAVSGVGYVGGTGNSPIAFTLNSNVTNSNTLFLNITNGFLWRNYALIFTGLTTSTPIFITNISRADVNSSNANVTINQNITLSSGATGTAYIVGNQMIIQTISGCPKVNMRLDQFQVFNIAGARTLINGFNYITAVQVQNLQNINNIYIITLYNSFPYEAQFAYYALTSQSVFVFTVTLPSGYYDVPALNTALQQQMFDNGHYFFTNYPVNGVSPSGYNNQGITYPISLDIDYTIYSLKITTPTLPSLSNLQTTYGSSAYVNTNYVVNGSFDDYSFFPLNNNGNVISLAGWNLTTTNGGQIFAQNGTALWNAVSYSPPTVQYTQFVYLISNIVSSSTVAITQSSSVYFPAGSYTLYYWARKSSVGGAGIDTLTITLNTNYTNTGISGTTWTRFSQAFTSTGQNITVAFSYFSSNTSQAISVLLTGIEIVNNNSLQQTTRWKGEYRGGGNGSVAFNAFQIPTYGYEVANNQLFYNLPNKYSIGQLLVAQRFNAFLQGGQTFPSFPYGIYLAPSNGIIIRCDLLQNPLNKNSDILDAFPILYAYGTNNLYTGDARNDIKIKKGKYSSLIITLCDLNGNPIKLLDNNVLLTFIIKKKYDHHITGFRGY